MCARELTGVDHEVRAIASGAAPQIVPDRPPLVRVGILREWVQLPIAVAPEEQRARLVDVRINHVRLRDAQRDLRGATP